MKISILSWCYSRQEMLDITLPLWAEQDYPDIELVVGCGSDIKIPEVGKDVVKVLMPCNGLSAGFNAMVKAATGDLVLLLHSDIKPNSKSNLAQMYANWEHGIMVTERFFRGNERDIGIWTQCMLIERIKLIESGGWDEFYDSGYAYEDSEVASRLVNIGMKYRILESPRELSCEHIPHDRPSMHNPAVVEKYAINKRHYHKNHKISIMELYQKRRLPTA